MNAGRSALVSKSMTERTGELAVVIFTDEGDAGWQPCQVFTRRWIKFADDSEGWSYTLYDGSWCARDEQLHLYNSGGGPPYVEGPATLDGKLYMHQIWLAPGESVSNNTARESDGPISDRRATSLSDDELLAIGYRRVDEHPGDIFSDASDDPTTWCEECKDNISRYENPCEHLATCWHCQASYTAEGDEERRCPDCNESQHKCDHCDEQGAETCISCGQWICPKCWAGHDDNTEDGKCERGAPDWKESA